MKFGDIISLIIIVLNIILGLFWLFAENLNYFEIIILTIILSFICAFIAEDDVADGEDFQKKEIKEENGRNERIVSGIILSIVILTVIFVIYLIGNGIIFLAGDWDSLDIEPDSPSELDEYGDHEINTTIVDVKKSSMMLFNEYDGEWRFLERSYILVDENNRPFHVEGGFIKDLNKEYNNSIEGHNMIISYSNTRGRASVIMYSVNNITTDTGKFFCTG